MTKSIHRLEHRVLLELLREQRLEAGLTQTQVSSELGRSQSFMSDVERGTRRLDLVELRDLCAVLKTDLVTFVGTYERALARNRRR